MHVHAYEKLWLGLAIVLVLALIVTVTYGAIGPGIAMVSDDQDTVDATALNEDERFADPRVEQVGEDEYDVYVQAFQFGFDPDPIVVPEHSTVNFYVTAPDVIHGMEIVGTNANVMVIPGEVARITVEVSEPREYGILCNEYCGAGHHDMEGTFEVVSEAEFEERADENDDIVLSTDDANVVGSGVGGDN